MQPVKYPENSAVSKLNSPIEVKKAWLFSEWDSRTVGLSTMLKNNFPKKDEIGSCDEKINTVFDRVRGMYSLWGPIREYGKWRKVVVPQLSLQWVKDNVEVLYPKDDRFSQETLDCIVLWKDPTCPKYQLFDGNHRISAWLSENKPETLPTTLFVGKMGKEKRTGLLVKDDVKEKREKLHQAETLAKIIVCGFTLDEIRDYALLDNFQPVVEKRPQFYAESLALLAWYMKITQAKNSWTFKNITPEEQFAQLEYQFKKLVANCSLKGDSSFLG